MMNKDQFITEEDFRSVNSNSELLNLIQEKKIKFNKVKEVLSYNKELRSLQIELVKLQHFIAKQNMRVAIIFEGRDAAGKGGNIRRFMEHLNPRSSRLVALNKPTEIEKQNR